MVKFSCSDSLALQRCKSLFTKSVFPVNTLASHCQAHQTTFYYNLQMPVNMSNQSLSWVQIFTVLSLPSAPDAIIFWEGWHETDITVSVWPSNFCTIFLVWSSHKYTQLSSEPPTIYFPFVTENVDEMQYFELTWPVYVFRNFPVEKFQSRCRHRIINGWKYSP